MHSTTSLANYWSASDDADGVKYVMGGVVADIEGYIGV